MHADPVPVTAPPELAVASVVFRYGHALYVTVVAKRSFALPAGAPPRPTAPAPILRAEIDEGGGRVVPDDVAPCLARGDVWATGHVRAPAPVVDVALRVRRDALTLLDKRSRLVADAAGLASLGPLGPVSKRWPARAERLRGVPPRLFEGPFVEIPDAMDWAYFQAAPLDQQVAWLAPGDEVSLEIAGVGALSLALPRPLPLATLSATTRAPEELTLRPDGVALDVARRLAHVLYRGRAALEGDPRRASVVVRLDVAPSALDAASTQATVDLAAEDVAALRARFALPFRAGSAPAYEPVPPPPTPARDGSTVAVDADELAELRARFHPFSAGQRQSDPPASAPPVSAAPGSAPPVTAGAQPGDGPALGGETVAASADEVSALRAAFATPFDKPSAKLARRQGAPPPPPPRAEAEQEREPARSGETSLVDAEEVERLRRLYAGPFSRRAATEPGAGAASPGASFLDVLGEEPEPDDG